MSIKNVQQLRDFVSEQLEALCNRTLKPEEANSAAMLAANILLSLRLEMDYAKLKREPPNIEFMENKNSVLIEHKPLKKIIKS